MKICRVVGSITATAKDPSLTGFKLMTVMEIGAPAADVFVAVDTVGAGVDATVLVVCGSAARLATATRRAPVDAVVVAILDAPWPAL